MGGWLDLLVGSLLLRPYVFAFLGIYLVAAAAEWGWRRAFAFTALTSGLAFAAEWTSTRVGFPFGLYHYTGVTAGRELYVSNVPLFDPLSFAFLAYASLGVARLLLARAGRLGEQPVPVALATGLLMMWLDLVIDPLAVRGDRWFLGRIFYYPTPGPYFGVPVANFAGWLGLGAVMAGAWLALGPRLPGRSPAWARRLPSPRVQAVLIYYAVLGFNFAVTAAVGEPGLLGASLLLHVPLAGLVVFSLPERRRGRIGGHGAVEPV